MADESRESVIPPQAPVEQLVSFLNGQMRLASEVHSMDVEARFGAGSENVDRNPQFLDQQSSDNLTGLPLERVMLRVPDSVVTSDYGFERVESPANDTQDPWDAAAFHVVRPLILEEFEPTEDDEEGVISVLRPDRFVIYIEMPSTHADQCYIAEPSPAGGFHLEEYDLELLGRREEQIADAIEALIAGISEEETEDQESADDELAEVESSESDDADRPTMDAFALRLLSHLRDKTSLHPFRAAA